MVVIIKKSLFIILIVVTIFLGFFSIGCGFQMLAFAEEGKDYTLNLIVHPISSIIFVALAVYLILDYRQ